MSVKAFTEGIGATSPRPWRVGKGGGAVVADGGCAREANGGGPCDLDSLDYYGGHLVAESIARPDAELIVRAVNAVAEQKAQGNQTPDRTGPEASRDDRWEGLIGNVRIRMHEMEVREERRVAEGWWLWLFVLLSMLANVGCLLKMLPWGLLKGVAW